MLVRLKRNWFGPNGSLYETRNGLAEIPEEFRDDLPSDAEVVSEDGTLPSKAPILHPGFGLKPEADQALDLIPGAAPTTQLDSSGAGEAQPVTDAKIEPDKLEKGLADAKEATAEIKAKADPQAKANKKLDL